MVGMFHDSRTSLLSVAPPALAGVVAVMSKYRRSFVAESEFMPVEQLE